jgi:hypothetical protein
VGGRKKLALILIKAMGIVVGRPIKKYNEEIPFLPLKRFRRENSGSHLVMVFPCKDRIPIILFVWGNVWFTQIRISGQFLCPDTPITLN